MAFFRPAKLALVALAFLLAAAPSVQSSTTATDTTSIVVIGDSLGEGLYTGLRILLQNKDGTTVTKWARVNTGIVRSDRYNWMDAADTIASQRKADIVVAMFGANDLQSIREGGHAYHYPSDSWKERYIGRIDHIMTTLKNAGMQVEWVGLPITRPNRYQKDYAFLNTIFKERAAANGVTYFDTWSVTADENGQYEAYGPDINNNTELIRDSDGIHFTGAGYVALASKIIAAMGL